MALSVLGVRVLHSQIVQRTLAELGHRLPGFEVFGLLVLAAVPNLFVPRSGFGTLALSLRARHGIPFAISSSLALPLAALDLIVISAVGLAVQTAVVGLAHPHAPVIAATFARGAARPAARRLVVRVPLRMPFAPPRLRALPRAPRRRLGAARRQPPLRAARRLAARRHLRAAPAAPDARVRRARLPPDLAGLRGRVAARRRDVPVSP